MALSSEVLMHSEMMSLQVEPQRALAVSGEWRRQEPQWKLPASWRTHFSSRRTASARSISLAARRKDWRMSLWSKERWENEMKWMKLSVGYAVECALEKGQTCLCHLAWPLTTPRTRPWCACSRTQRQWHSKNAVAGEAVDARDRICLTSLPRRCEHNSVRVQEHQRPTVEQFSDERVRLTTPSHADANWSSLEGAVLSLHQFLPRCLNDVLHAVAQLSADSSEKVHKVDWWKTVDVVARDCWTLLGRNNCCQWLFRVSFTAFAYSHVIRTRWWRWPAADCPHASPSSRPVTLGRHFDSPIGWVRC